MTRVLVLMTFILHLTPKCSSTERHVKLRTLAEELNCVQRRHRSLSCPWGFDRFGTQCYAFVTTPKTGAEAEWHCNVLGGTLANIKCDRVELLTQMREISEYALSTTSYDNHQYDAWWVGGIRRNGGFFYEDDRHSFLNTSEHFRCVAQHVIEDDDEEEPELDMGIVLDYRVKNCHKIKHPYVCAFNPESPCPGGFERYGDQCLLFSKVAHTNPNVYCRHLRAAATNDINTQDFVFRRIAEISWTGLDPMQGSWLDRAKASSFVGATAKSLKWRIGGVINDGCETVHFDDGSPVRGPWLKGFPRDFSMRKCLIVEVEDDGTEEYRPRMWNGPCHAFPFPFVCQAPARSMPSVDQNHVIIGVFFFLLLLLVVSRGSSYDEDEEAERRNHPQLRSQSDQNLQRRDPNNRHVLFAQPVLRNRVMN